MTVLPVSGVRLFQPRDRRAVVPARQVNGTIHLIRDPRQNIRAIRVSDLLKVRAEDFRLVGIVALHSDLNGRR